MDCSQQGCALFKLFQYNAESSDVLLLGDGAGGFGFGPRTDFASDSRPISVAIADLNGDGALDLAVAGSDPLPGSGDLSILLGDGTGGFGPRTPTMAAGSPSSVAIGDLDMDGKSDLAVANSESVNASVILGDGNGGFGIGMGFATGSRR